MPSKVKILIGAAVAAVVVFFFVFRRRAQAAQQYAVTAATPTPMAALTALQAPTPHVPLSQLPTTATASALAYAQSLLPPVVGAGVNAFISSGSAAKPADAPCQLTADQQANLAKIAPGPGRDQVAKDWCRVNAEKAAGTYKPTGIAAALAKVATQVQAQQSYKPSVGYYG